MEIKEVLLAIFFLADRIVGRTKLQKMIYLLQREQKIPAGLNFEIYLYGPFSRDLNNEVDNLVKGGELKCNLGLTHSKGIYYEFHMSESGRKEASKIWDGLAKEKQNRFLKLISKFNSMSTSDIVRYVYEKYPDAKPKEDSDN